LIINFKKFQLSLRKSTQKYIKKNSTLKFMILCDELVNPSKKCIS